VLGAVLGVWVVPCWVVEWCRIGCLGGAVGCLGGAVLGVWVKYHMLTWMIAGAYLGIDERVAAELHPVVGGRDVRRAGAVPVRRDAPNLGLRVPRHRHLVELILDGEPDLFENGEVGGG